MYFPSWKCSMIMEAFNPSLKRHIEYVESEGYQMQVDTRGVVAVDKDLKVMGAILFDSFLPNSAVATIKVTNSMALCYNGLITESVNYFYDVTKRKIMRGLIRESNMRALKLARKIGFKQIYHIPHAHSEGDGIFGFTMTKEECNFYNGSYV